ncbi:MAG: FliA/WhiG family RNA polymerase sigma factor [Sphingomonadales bacterium]|nr:FliA/WhiG family RNA polymerase sigma factor [Sphingomonadales bacterium]
MRAAGDTAGWGAGSTAADARITAHLPLVRKIAWHVHGKAPGAVELEELMQTGVVALVEASRSYEDRGHAFATYAGMRVRGAMIDLIRRNATICRSAIIRRRDIAATRARLTLENGYPPDDAQMAAAMGLPAAEWHALVQATAGVQHASIDEVYSEHSMWFADDRETADEAIDRRALAQQLAAHIAQLPEREGMVLQLYFVEELNLEEIGAVLGVGAARVCQIKKAALDRLRGAMAPGMMDDGG